MGFGGRGRRRVRPHVHDRIPSGAWPVVTASAESNGSVARFAMILAGNISATVRRERIRTAADADFYFIAVGTR